MPGLSLVTIGRAADQPAELFEVTQLARVFAEMRVDADAIVVDSAPLLAISDAMTVARVSDVIVMVADLRRTRRTSARTAAQEIKTTSHAAIVGIANAAPRSLSISPARPPATAEPRPRTPTAPPPALHTTRPQRHNGIKPGRPDLARPPQPTHIPGQSPTNNGDTRPGG